VPATDGLPTGLLRLAPSLGRPLLVQHSTAPLEIPVGVAVLIHRIRIHPQALCTQEVRRLLFHFTTLLLYYGREEREGREGREGRGGREECIGRRTGAGVAISVGNVS
jgi:hypothetical protein